MNITGATTERNLRGARALRITSFVLTLMLAATVSLGFPLHSSNTGCNPAAMQNAGCEHMGIAPNASVDGVPVCCLLDHQEPGQTALAFKLPLPTFKAVAPVYVTVSTGLTSRRLPQQPWRQSSTFTPPDIYLRNLALLI